MFEEEVIFPKSIYIDKFNFWNLDTDNPYDNIIQIGGTDYIISYLNIEIKGNKGGNSYVFSLHSAQDFEEIGFTKPLLAMKISKVHLKKRTKPAATKRFENELEALLECDKKNFSNVVKVYNSGVCNIKKKINKKDGHNMRFPFYTMEYADYDLKKYIEEEKPNLYERINLCLEIANGLKELYSLGYYHRDIKPDNIFMAENTWKIGDLGLIDSRIIDMNIDGVNALVGPRGWYCPEAMNKFLTENKGFEFRFDCKIDHQSDIFQLGKVFWYILQGNAPIGCIKPNDFKIKNSRLYVILRTMLNHSKQRRYNKIDEVIDLLYPIYEEYYKTA